jgi:hypothetical protein
MNCLCHGFMEHFPVFLHWSLYNSIAESKATEAKRLLLACGAHEWKVCTKRPRWSVCSKCKAIKDDSRNIKPRIWLWSSEWSPSSTWRSTS